MHAQVTLAVSDRCPGGLEGFAPLSGPLPASVFASATEDGEPMGQSDKHYAVFLDLIDERGQIDEKCISIAQAAAILDLSAETLVPLGRQRLSQINDEAREYIARRHSA